jgi:rhodanese-related sulfurtransferase
VPRVVREFHPSLVRVLLLFSVEAAMESLTEVTRITPDEVKERMDRGEPFTFIDARNPKDWAEAKEQLPGAIRVPADEVEKHLSEIPRDRTIVAYCT